MRLQILLTALLAMLVGTWPAHAHDVRPAYLEIVEQRSGPLQVTFRQPMAEGRAPMLRPVISGVPLGAKAEEKFGFDHVQRRWVIPQARKAIAGAEVRIRGLEATLSEVLVHAVARDGRTFETILRPDRPAVKIEFGRSAAALAVKVYFALGVEHILAGIDHLAFVLALVLLIGINARLIWAITAFTLAHSITLGASTLGLNKLPVSAIEALIALSILLVAAELVRRRGSETLINHSPWLVAFVFGLLHGFGFAGALSDIGLPEDSVPLALLLFNLGVEAGQLVFVAVLLALLLAVKRLPAHFSRWKDPARGALAYGLGGFGGFLFVERTAAVFA